MFLTSEKSITRMGNNGKKYVFLCINLVAAIVKANDDVTVTVNKEEPYYNPPKLLGNAYFSEAFPTVDSLKQQWVLSEAKKEDESDDDLAKYDGKWELEPAGENGLRGDMGLVLKTKAKHAAISAKLSTVYEFTGKPFIVQYEVKFQNPMECGGAYIKLLQQTPGLDLKQLTDKTPYTVMFGPDKCGNDAKLHFIFQHKDPKTGLFEEKHANKPKKDTMPFFADKKTHLYTLIVQPDNTWEIKLDQEKVNGGSLLTDMDPPVNPPEEIDDPNDSRPADWDEREKIADPDAVKPDDWDEDAPAQIPDEAASKPSDWLDDQADYVADPDAVKPQDWDDEMDGEWEAPKIENPLCAGVSGCGEWERPMVSNPAHKGKWRAPMIDNPAYKGVWKPRRIRNPNWFHDPEPYKMTPIGAVALELWSMTDQVMFDNFIVTDSVEVADQWAADTWALKSVKESKAIDGDGILMQMFNYTNERPWLWAVYVLVVALPAVIIFTYCFSSKGPKDDDVGRRKKTDFPMMDDEMPSSSKSTSTTPSTSEGPRRRGKGALEVDEAEAEADSQADEVEAEAEAEADSQADSQQDSQQSAEESAEEVDQVADSGELRKSPRRRKPRKE